MRFSQKDMFNAVNEVSPTQVYEFVKDKLGFVRNWTGNIDDHKDMIEKAFGMYYNAGLPDRDLVSEKIAKKDYSGAANLMLSMAGGGNVDFHDFNQATGYKSKGYDMLEARAEHKIDKTSLIRYATEQGKRVFGNNLSYEKVESMVRRAVDLTREQSGDTNTALGILRRFLSPMSESVVRESSIDDLIDREIAPEFGLESVEEFEDIDFDDLEEAAKGKGSAKAILQKAVKKAEKEYNVDEPEAKSMIFGRLRKLRSKPKGKRKAKKDEQTVGESAYNDTSVSAGGAAAGSFPHEPTISKKNPIDHKDDYLPKKNKKKDAMAGEDEGDEDTVAEGWNDTSVSAGGAASGSFPHEPTISKKNPIDHHDDYLPADKLFFKDIEKGDQGDVKDLLQGKVSKKTVESFLNSEISYEELTQAIEDDEVVEELDEIVYPIDEAKQVVHLAQNYKKGKVPKVVSLDAYCGGDSEKDGITLTLDNVTCPNCLKKMEKSGISEQIDEGSAGIQRMGVDSGEVVDYEGESLPVMAFQYTDPTKGMFLGMGDGAYPSDYDVPNGAWIAYVYSKTDGVNIWAWGDNSEEAVDELLSVF